MRKLVTKILQAIGVVADEPAPCQAKNVVVVRRNPEADKTDCTATSIDPRMSPALTSKRVAVVFSGDPAKQNVEITRAPDTEY